MKNSSLEVFAAISTLVLHPLGQLLLGIAAWLIGMAYVAGVIRTEIHSLSDRIALVEKKVDEIDHAIRPVAIPHRDPAQEHP